MKKKIQNLIPLSKPGIKKLLLTMKLSLIIVFLCVLQVSANVYSQINVSLDVHDKSVREVLKTIEQQSQVRFFYSDDLLVMNDQIDIKADNKNIIGVLDDIFSKSPLTYKAYDNNLIVIAPRELLQQQRVTGIITDANTGEPIAGVTILVEGTLQGTITDAKGLYSIPVPGSRSILVFSFIGYTTQKIEVGASTTLDLAMLSDIQSLDEVVVIGYGSAKRKDIIGSVATVRSEDLVNPVFTDFNQMLQGKASGVFVSNGNIRIRGMNSISSSTEPLYVIDGVVMANAGNLINPNDIESIDIQKDAAATAIYGSRASNGVIMITTKSGKSGQNSFNIDVSSGVTSFLNKGFSRADATTQLAAMDLSIQNSRHYDPTILDRKFDPKDAFTYDVKFLTDEAGNTRNFDYLTRDYVKNVNTDLAKAVRQNGSYKEINLSSNKSFDHGGLYFSMQYRDEKGIFKGDNGNKLTARLGMNFTPLRDLKLGFISTVGYTKHTNGIQGVSDRWLPFMPLYDETSSTGLWVPAANPLARANHNYSDNNQTNLRSISNFNAEYTVPFIKGLSVKAVVGYDFITNRNSNWSSPLMNDAQNSQPFSRADENRNNGFIALANIGLNYNRTFGDHNFSGVLYQEGQKTWSYYMNMEAEKLSSIYHEIGSNPGVLKSMNAGLGNDFRILSTLGRLDYKYKERYLLQGSLRRDATSKFNPDNQNATFASVGAGWIVSEEAFLKNGVSWMNLLKIRGSIGQTGNGDMPDFKYMNAYSIGKLFMNQQYSFIQNIGNPDVTWETSNNKDIGIDFGFLKNKINGSIAYYKKNVNGLLLEVPLPMSAGIEGGNSVWQNIGDMSNSGIELNINYAAVKATDFSWDLSFNFSTNKNEILALHPAIDVKGWGIEGNYAITKKGEKLATFYMPEFAGIDPERGIPMIYERDQTIYSTTGETVKTGNLIPFNSITGAANRMIQQGKSSMPDWYGGFTNNVRFKDFDLNLMFSFAGGCYFINEAARSSRNVSFGWQRLADDIIENSWKKPGDIAKYSELIYGGGFYYNSAGEKIDKPVEEYGLSSTQDLVKGNYLRLRFLTLGYNLPNSVVSKLHINGLRVYFSANNPFTFSKAPKAIDPEMNIPGNLDGNTVYYGLPPVRTSSFGISLRF